MFVTWVGKIQPSPTQETRLDLTQLFQNLQNFRALRRPQAVNNILLVGSPESSDLQTANLIGKTSRQFLTPYINFLSKTQSTQGPPWPRAPPTLVVQGNRVSHPPLLLQHVDKNNISRSSAQIGARVRRRNNIQRYIL